MATETKTPQSQGTPSKEQSSEKKEVTFTEAEHLKAISDERTIAGRLKTQLDAVTKERDGFKSQAEQAKREAEEASNTLKETETRIADLEADLETATEDNVDLSEITKIKKELRVEKDKARQETKTVRESLAAEKKALDAERETWAGTVAEAQEAKFLVDAFEIAEEFEGSNFERLKTLCEKAGKRKPEEIRELAEVLWSKKGMDDKNERTLVADSGVTSGGGVSWDSLTPKERREETAKRLREQRK